MTSDIFINDNIKLFLDKESTKKYLDEYFKRFLLKVLKSINIKNKIMISYFPKVFIKVLIGLLNIGYDLKTFFNKKKYLIKKFIFVQLQNFEINVKIIKNNKQEYITLKKGNYTFFELLKK